MYHIKPFTTYTFTSGIPAQPATVAPATVAPATVAPDAAL